MDVLYINNISVSVSNLDIEKGKLWSEGSGRATNGYWTGDIKARKYKLSCDIMTLTQEECATILNAVDANDYFKVKFIDPYSSIGAWKEITCYASDTKISVYNYVTKRVRYKNIKFSTIER